MPKYEIVQEAKTKTKQKLNQKGQERVWQIQSAGDLFNRFRPPTRESRVFIKQHFYNRIASLSKEMFGFYLTLEKRRNAEDLVEHFASAPVFAKTREPCHLCVLIDLLRMPKVSWMLQAKY